MNTPISDAAKASIGEHVTIIDAVLPRVATWPPKSYDLTDPDERAEAVTWLCGLLGDETGSVGTVGADEAETALWGPPKPGTHEGDLAVSEGPCLDCGRKASWPECVGHRGGDREFGRARQWSWEHA